MIRVLLECLRPCKANADWVESSVDIELQDGDRTSEKAGDYNTDIEGDRLGSVALKEGNVD